jgi:hypothetical protein
LDEKAVEFAAEEDCLREIEGREDEDLKAMAGDEWQPN